MKNLMFLLTLLNAAPDSIEFSQKKSFFGTVLSHLLLVNDFYFSWLNISKKNTNKARLLKIWVV